MEEALGSAWGSDAKQHAEKSQVLEGRPAGRRRRRATMQPGKATLGSTPRLCTKRGGGLNPLRRGSLGVSWVVQLGSELSLRAFFYKTKIIVGRRAKPLPTSVGKDPVRTVALVGLAAPSVSCRATAGGRWEMGVGWGGGPRCGVWGVVVEGA